MDDMRDRLSALDDIEMPDLWPRIEQRAAAAEIAAAAVASGPSAWRPLALLRFAFATTVVAVLGGFVVVTLLAGQADPSRSPMVGASSGPSVSSPDPSAPTRSAAPSPPAPTAVASEGQAAFTGMLEKLETTTRSGGIRTVLGDGAQHTFIPWNTPYDAAPAGAVRIVAGPTVGRDGSLWVVGQGQGRTAELIQVGRRRDTPLSRGLSGDLPELEAGSDGTLWLTGPYDLTSFDGRAWHDHGEEAIELASEILALDDGSVWVTGFSDEPFAGSTDPTEGAIGFLDADGLVDRRGELRPLLGVDPSRMHARELTPGPNGTFLALVDIVDAMGSERLSTELVRHIAGDWEHLPSPLDDASARLLRLAADPSGSFWAYYASDPSDAEGIALVHVTAEATTVYTGADDGVPTMRGSDGPDRDPDALQVGPDGIVWMATEDGRLASFDGLEWSAHDLRELDRFAIGPDGTVIALDRQGSLMIIRSDERGLSATDAAADDVSGEVVTVEVEPGVHRVVSDGLRDLAFGGRSPESDTVHASTISVGPGGDVWIIGREQYFPLGRRGQRWASRSPYTDREPSRNASDATTRYLPRPFEPDRSDDIEVGADGTLWFAVSGSPWAHQSSASDSYGEIHGLWHYDGERWRQMGPDADVRGVEVQADGTVWAAWDDSQSRSTTVRRYDGETWRDVGQPIPWQSSETARSRLRVTADGDAVVHVEQPYHLDGERWVAMGSATDPALEVIGAVGIDEDQGRLRLSHWAGGSWQLMADTEVPRDGNARLRPFHALGADGSVWMPLEGERRCGGLGRFDGEDWQRFLDGVCVVSLDIAPDGTVWLLGSRIEWNRNGNEMQRVRQLEAFFIAPDGAEASLLQEPALP